jgi:CRP-like cAMP-binding protein
MTFVHFLKQIDIFYEMTDTQLQLVSTICQELHYEKNDIVFEEGSAGQELYMIVSGEIEIQVEPATGTGRNPALTIATLRRGQSFGEVALVDQGLRSALARCSQPETTLLMIPRDKLMLLCDSYPQLGYRLMRNLAADLAMKMRNTDLQVREYLARVRRGSSISQP